MGKVHDRIAEGLFKAIQAEIEGQHFYKMAANSTQDEKGKEVLLMLASDEAMHANFLKHQYDSFLKSGKVDESVSLGKPRFMQGSSPIFSNNFKARLDSSHFEMSALSIGIQLELNAMQFYKAEAAECEDEYMKRFYLELAEWERGHYQMLLAQQENLKEDYWEQAGFAPF